MERRVSVLCLLKEEKIGERMLNLETKGRDKSDTVVVTDKKERNYKGKGPVEI